MYTAHLALSDRADADARHRAALKSFSTPSVRGVEGRSSAMLALLCSPLAFAVGFAVGTIIR